MSAEPDLNTAIQYIKGIGPKRADALATAGILTVNDILHYYPRRYLDRTTVKSIRDIKKDDEATIVGTIEVCGERKRGNVNYIKLLCQTGPG